MAFCLVLADSCPHVAPTTGLTCHLHDPFLPLDIASASAWSPPPSESAGLGCLLFTGTPFHGPFALVPLMVSVPRPCPMWPRASCFHDSKYMPASPSLCSAGKVWLPLSAWTFSNHFPLSHLSGLMEFCIPPTPPAHPPCLTINLLMGWDASSTALGCCYGLCVILLPLGSHPISLRECLQPSDSLGISPVCCRYPSGRPEVGPSLAECYFSFNSSGSLNSLSQTELLWVFPWVMGR